MFNGGDQIRVSTNRSMEEICNLVEDVVHDLGPVRMSSSGRFSIDDGRQSGFFTQVRYNGEVHERKSGEGIVISLDYEVAPSTACWIFGIGGFLMCVFPALVFLFPLLAKSDVEKAARRTLDDIEDQLSPDRREKAP